MGKEKYKSDIEKLFERSAVVSYDSVEKIVRNKKKVKQYVKRIISYMLKRRKIRRLAKGYYTSRENVSLAVFCFQPAYLGLQDAMGFYNLWEQETIPIIVTCRNVRQGIRKIMGVNVLVRKIKREYFFGMVYDMQEGVAVPYSDIEKTLIDMIYFGEGLDKEAIQNFKKKINLEKLRKYLRKYPKKVRERVFGVLGKGRGI